MKRTALVHYKFERNPFREHAYVELFGSPTDALQWADRKAAGTAFSADYAADLKASANALIEGRVDTVYYKGCDITTNLTENK